MASATISPPSKSGFKSNVSRWSDTSGGAKTSAAAAGGHRSMLISDETNEKMKLLEEVKRMSGESRAYWESLGYTEESFMEMVHDEIHEGRQIMSREEWEARDSK